MFGLGPWELAIIAVILLLLFGAKRIPGIGKGLGGALRELRNIKKEINSSDSDSEKSENNSPEKKETGSGFIEDKIKNKMLSHVPGAKKAMEINDKIKKVKEVIK
ncbi:twin-arginine translocase TatA/TatE family subunit [Thermodesulfobacteriota bacterium]